MVDISEDSSYYSGFDKQIHKDNRTFYVDDWSWDTFLAQHPLRTILNPSMEEDMLHSYVRMYEQSGWMPTFPVLYGDHVCMNAFHSSISFLDPPMTFTGFAALSVETQKKCSGFWCFKNSRKDFYILKGACL
jgi:hypothetical protein